MEDKKNKPVDKQQLKIPTGKSVTGKPLDGIEIRPQLKGLGNRQHNENAVVLTDTLAEKKALTLVQRQRRARILRAKEPKMQRAKEVAQHRLASDEKLKARAINKARNIVKMRFSARRGTPYTELTTSEKIQVDKVVDKKVALIRKLAARLLPSLRKAEVNRLASFQSGAKLQHATAGPVNEEFNNIVESLDSKTSMQLVDIINDSIDALNENDNSLGITLKRLLNAVLPEDAATATLIQKAERTGIPFSTLREVFERGSFAWENDGKATQEQFSFARVNSYIAKGRAWTLDADLREEKLINDKLDNVFEATYRGKKVPLNKSMKGDVKKSKVYVDPDYHAKVHQDLQWHAGRNRSNSTGAANYHHLITLDDPSHIETYYEKTVHPILKKHNYPTPPEGPGDGGNPKYHAAVQEIIKNWRNEPRGMRNEGTELDEKRGLWDNIHAKRKRIKAGSGERMRKPGSEGAPTKQNFRDASESIEQDTGNGTNLVDKQSANSKIRKKIEAVDRASPHTEHGKQSQIMKKIIDEEGNTQLDPKKRLIGTDALVKAFKRDTPGQSVDELFQNAFDARADVEEEVRSADVEGVVVRTASGKTIIRKQKVNHKIIGTGNLNDGKPDDTL